MDTLVKKSFHVEGMTCASCAVSVESMLKAQKGVINAAVNYADQSTLVEYESGNVKPSDLKKVVQSIGYDLVIDEHLDPEAIEAEKEKHYRKVKINTILAFVLSTPVVIIGMFFHDSFPLGNWISLVLTAPVLFWFGRGFFVNAYKQTKHLKANMDTLVALSTGIAFVFSSFNTLFPEVLLRQGLEPYVYFEAASVIIAFILLGRLLEERAKSRTSSALKKLMGLQVKSVKVIRAGVEQEIKVEEVQKQDEIVIRPGEKIPVDGIVIKGSSYIDESMISGEPIPVEKKAESKVFAGTINQKGSLYLRAEKVGSETVLAQIIQMVKQAQGSKAPVQKLVDKVAGIFVPTVILIAIVTFFAWWIFGGDHLVSQGLFAAITVLIIACPCALGLATPTAIMVGVGKGAERGILIKDAESLELAYKVNAVVLDKTGTITKGKPEVSDMIWSERVTNGDVLKQVMLSAEAQSEHPLAEAVVKKLKETGVKSISLDSFESVTGKGVKVSLNGSYYFIGSPKWIEEQGVANDHDLAQVSKKFKTEGKTVIYFSDDKNILAAVAIADTIKETSLTAVRELKERNIEVYMLTGDNFETAKAVAEKVGIEHYKAEVLPSDKSDFVRELQKQGKVVAMVGDGINDSQALAQADVGIAMAKGTDIAMDVAKITLMNSDLQHITEALKLSKATIKTIRQNLFWAFIYNLIGVPIAAGILYPFTGFMLNPMIAGAAMALSSVSVVANSLRLK